MITGLKKPEKGKKHGQIRIKLLFIPSDYKLIFWYNNNFCRRLSNFSRLKTTILLLHIYV